MFAFAFVHPLFEFEYEEPQFVPLLALPPHSKSSLSLSTLLSLPFRFQSGFMFCLW